jgi:2-iminobutanoate/2-iminopropanoate deaminase
VDEIVRHNPRAVYPPIGNLYSHGIEIPAGARLLFIAGQVGVDVNGNCPESCEAQLEIAWTNIKEILKAARMTMNDLINVTCYLKDPMYATAYARSCNKFLGSNKPAMTFLNTASKPASVARSAASVCIRCAPRRRQTRSHTIPILPKFRSGWDMPTCRRPASMTGIRANPKTVRRSE